MEEGERGLALAEDEAKAAGLARVSRKLLAGVPWHAIVETLADPSFDLVVMGSHGRTGLARVLLGSVAEKVVRHAPCPVLVVRPSSQPKPFTHVLCPVDFSAYSRDAMELAAELVRPGGAGILLFHSLELPVAYAGDPHVPDFMSALDQRSAALLERWAADLRGKVKVPVTTCSRIGRPGQQTLALLEHEPTVDLVVIGSHGHTGIKRALLGSVAEKVVRHAQCPVLVAHRRRA
jgi:nucleotide-binding universal stress UspA family protein